jgi:hypothetical protein
MTQNVKEMRSPSKTVFAMFLVAVFVPLGIIGALLRNAFVMRSTSEIEPVNHIHLISGRPDRSKASLFTLHWDSMRNEYVVNKGRLPLLDLQGEEVQALPADGKPKKVVVGRYIYRITCVKEPSGDAPPVRWELIGAQVGVGDNVGRVPGFRETGKLTYEPSQGGGHDLPLWMNGMPANAFTLMSADACKTNPSHAPCFEVADQSGRMTLATVPRDNRNTNRQFVHLTSGERIAVTGAQQLWIANLPFQVERLGTEGAVNLYLPDDSASLLGDRSQLGSSGFHGEFKYKKDGAAGSFPSEVVFDDVVQESKKEHIGDHRWEPESEDELQLLIDAGTLCLVYERGSTQSIESIVPQLKWADTPGQPCDDPLAALLATKNRSETAVRSLDARLLQPFQQHRVSDPIVTRTNELLRRVADVPPTSFPLEFEWWPIKTKDGIQQMPMRVWGVRVGATDHELNPDPSTQNASAIETNQVILHDAAKKELLLTYRKDGQRWMTKEAKLMGLGPLLGYPGKVEGIDAIAEDADAIRGNGKKGGKLPLTIDPALQRALWKALKTKLADPKLGVRPDMAAESEHFGVTGVAMDSETGDILAVLNWPSATIWEDDEKLRELEARKIGEPLVPSENWAMMRADKVGSVLKLLTIYTMANAGVLDNEVGTAGEACGGNRKNQAQLHVLLTQDGKVKREPVHLAFHDGQSGPMPTDPSGLSGGLDKATGTSCNAYFSLAATMLLDSEHPKLRHSAQCPVNDKSERTEKSKPNEWILCDLLVTDRFREEKGGGPSHWLLLPEGETLGPRSLKPLQGKNGAGYFKTAIQAGFRLGYEDENTKGQLRGTRQTFYGLGGQSTPYRTDWMMGLPKEAVGQVFVYPAMFDPLHFFGRDGESAQYGNLNDNVPNTHAIKGSRSSWREFASQAIGEDGQGSALSVAALYAGVGRDDGKLPAPRLVDKGSTSLNEIIDPQAIAKRLGRIRQALRAPLTGGGTANQVARILAAAKPLLSDENAPPVAVDTHGFFAKTGTFTIESEDEELQAEKAEARGVSMKECGLVALEDLVAASPSPMGATLLGTESCEKHNHLVTGVHRYPTNVVADPAGNGPRPLAGTHRKRHQEGHTTFAVVIPRPANKGSVVFAMISDLDEHAKGPGGELTGRAARNISEPMIREIWAWLNTH